jgi:carbon-monoxide dehydrogenase iron sulfur subunit
MKWEAKGLYVPMSCQQCQDAPCLNICPVKAISKDDKLGRVMVDYDVCIGCRSCVAICPFGAMSYNAIDKMVSSAISATAIPNASVSVMSRPWISLTRTT